jgi:hypothetical protein
VRATYSCIVFMALTRNSSDPMTQSFVVGGVWVDLAGERVAER